MSKPYVQKHFETFIGEILRRIPADERKTLTTVVVDSWERGKQNYTDSIYAKFRQRFGYELDYTNPSCKKDLDRLISDLVASEYTAIRFLSELRNKTRQFAIFLHFGEFF